MGLFSQPEDPELKMLRRETDEALKEAEKAAVASSFVRGRVGALRRNIRYAQRRTADEATADNLEIQLYPPLPEPAPTGPDVDALVAGPPAPPTMS